MFVAQELAKTKVSERGSILYGLEIVLWTSATVPTLVFSTVPFPESSRIYAAMRLVSPNVNTSKG